tara:strand:+ start:8116 stop:9039 length:924 start_codon:yes stop_codon:yes gene_type:complete
MKLWLTILLLIFFSISLIIIISLLVNFYSKNINNYDYDDYDVPLENKLQGVIVEMRKHNAIPHVLKNFSDKLPNVPIFFIHGTKNKDFVLEVINSMPNLNIKLLQLNAENLDSWTYSKLLTSVEFWYNIGNNEKTLIFQTDSGILGSKNEIKKFLKYDYIGAPWRKRQKFAEIDKEWIPKTRVGNGGLSIRNTNIAKIQSLIYGPITTQLPEDVFFVKLCEQDNCNLPSYKEGRKFSEERIRGIKPWAFHNNNNKYGIKPINHLNKIILELNRKVSKNPHSKLGNTPDLKTWEPKLINTNINYNNLF